MSEDEVRRRGRFSAYHDNSVVQVGDVLERPTLNFSGSEPPTVGRARSTVTRMSPSGRYIYDDQGERYEYDDKAGYWRSRRGPFIGGYGKGAAWIARD